MTTLPEEAVRRLKELAAAAGRELGDAPPAGLPDFVLPLVRREFARYPASVPLRRNIDYQGSARKAFLFCGVCGGIIESQDDHARDPDACEREKVRQVMES